MDPNDLQPGQSYTPGPAVQPVGQNPDALSAVSHVEAPQAMQNLQQPVSQPAPAQLHQDAPAQPQDNPLHQAYAVNESGSQPPIPEVAPEQVPKPNPKAETTLETWSAPEFAFTTKPAGWFLALAVFFACLIGIAVLTKQWLSIGLFALMGVSLAVYANRKPRTLNYALTTHGIHVGEKTYGFDNFSAFYEVSDYGQRVFELVPSKRLGTLVSLPIPHEIEEDLGEMLGTVLPKVPARNDVIDRVFRYLRF